MKPIQIKKTTIDIPFVDDEGNELLMLQFDRSDENIERFYNDYDDLMDKIQNAKEDAKISEVRPLLKDITDAVLSEGAFDNLYKLSPSSHIVTIYIAQIFIGIKEELEKEDLKELEKQLFDGE